jgi:hypothetical protein
LIFRDKDNLPIRDTSMSKLLILLDLEFARSGLARVYCTKITMWPHTHGSVPPPVLEINLYKETTSLIWPHTGDHLYKETTSLTHWPHTWMYSSTVVPGDHFPNIAKLHSPQQQIPSFHPEPSSVSVGVKPSDINQPAGMAPSTAHLEPLGGGEKRDHNDYNNGGHCTVLFCFSLPCHNGCSK